MVQKYQEFNAQTRKKQGRYDKRLIINKIQIVPNPSNGNFKFQTDNQTKIHKFTLAIYNVNGTQINTFHSLELNSIVNLDLKAGLYIIKITVEDGTTSCQKLIINK
ncbi:MAG: T9SS type A sorting domain-containing protein [Saprospiraceae bacterium]|jgi:hypothetical protein|nr:T9SS type A sorting domain-containing protein [Saprospiraceae bacterium]